MTEQEKLHKLSGNALLHLYLNVSETKRFVTLAQRNQILVRYLKPYIKSPLFKGSTKRLKSLVSVGQKQGDMEKALLGVRELVSELEAVDVDSDQKQFFALFESIQESQWKSAVFKDGMKVERETVYVPENDLVASFNNVGKQVAPISVFAQTQKIESLMLTLAKQNRFRLDVKAFDPASCNVHIQLCAIDH